MPFDLLPAGSSPWGARPGTPAIRAGGVLLVAAPGPAPIEEAKGLRALGLSVTAVALPPMEADPAGLTVEPVQRVDLRSLLGPLAGGALRDRLLGQPARTAGIACLLMRQGWLPQRAALGQAARLGVLAQRLGCRHIHAVAPDAGGLVAVLAGALTGLPVSLAVDAEPPRPVAEPIAALLRMADRVVVPCPAIAEGLLDLLPPGHPPRVVPPLVDAERFRPLRGAEDAPRIPRLLAVAEAPEAVAMLLRALASLPWAERPAMDLLPMGPLAETHWPAALRGAARSLAPELRLLDRPAPGWLEAAGPHYAGFVSPGAAPSPMLLPAMAMGLPVLAVDAPGLRALIPVEAGHLVPPDAPLPLARALAWLGQLPEPRRALMGHAAREALLRACGPTARAQGLAVALGLVTGAAGAAPAASSAAVSMAEAPSAEAPPMGVAPPAAEPQRAPKRISTPRSGSAPGLCASIASTIWRAESSRP